jgi:hypothetical protein
MFPIIIFATAALSAIFFIAYIVSKPTQEELTEIKSNSNHVPLEDFPHFEDHPIVSEQPTPTMSAPKAKKKHYRPKKQIK